MATTDTEETTAVMPPGRPKPPPYLAEAGQDEQQAADAGLGEQEARTISNDDNTSQKSQPRAPCTTQATTGEKRKRETDVAQPVTESKRQMKTLPFRSKLAALSRSHQTKLVGVGVPPSSAEPVATEGQKFLNALFSVVSMNRLLRQRWELYEDCRGKYRRRCHVVESFQTGLEELEKKKSLRIVNQNYLNEMVEYRNQLKIFMPGMDELKEETNKLLREHDGLRDEVDAMVEDLFVHGKSLKDDEALQFLTQSSDFWETFESRRSVANTAAESVRVRREEIEAERLAIRGRIDGRFNRVLLGRLAHVNAMGKDSKAVVTPSKTPTGKTTDRDLRRLSELVLQERNLKYKEKFRDVKMLRSQSEDLLKLAKRAFVEAKLLEPDGNESFQQGWYGKVEQSAMGEDAENSA